MQFLELKIPPPIVAVIVGILMWCIRLIAPSGNAAPSARLWLAGAFAAIGLVSALSGAIAFRRAKTTTNPLKPGAASSLVSSGPYQFTRNPMYLGLSLILIAWATYLWLVWALVGPLVFVVYIRRFQIAPEERALSALFGAEYGEYQTRVRRWL
jgi:protein-S-isoprenylcysteine O-methyltransferase Ste14